MTDGSDKSPYEHPPLGNDGGNPESYGQNPPPQQNYGGYPPPPQNYGAYPPPQQNYGNYPPPQQNYGNYPPPPPMNPVDSGYGYGGAPTLTVGNALSYGWNKFKANAGVWVGIMLVAAVISAVVSYLTGGFSSNTDDLAATFSILNILGTLASAVVSYLLNAAFVRGALHETDGNKPSFAAFFQFSNVLAVVLSSVLVGLLTGIGFVLLIIPGIVVIFLTWWTLQFVLDHDLGPIGAIKASAKAISSNFGTLFVLALACVGINIVGAIPIGLGLLITVPVTIIAGTFAYRVVTGGRVA
ncbi:hypothetical protein GCM10007304_35500 [Rhodococcoides trifolii]|uniref:Integral membrane protein n=1 Tax=Rhodococcoides trifolii TaxID=908250 RepID=A0A917LFJ8_9NOCA|nr:hypothetical protein [Rhodococcus trifolii]GGG18432.1 hypothetical protein GCM10007304_35500 [Rhodococcus trifolii]